MWHNESSHKRRGKGVFNYLDGLYGGTTVFCPQWRCGLLASGFRAPDVDCSTKHNNYLPQLFPSPHQVFACQRGDDMATNVD